MPSSLMDSVVRRALAAGFLFVAASSPSLLAADNAPAEPPSAKALVQAALRAEIDGQPERRQKLLQDALELDPKFAPAHWHSGQVRWNDKWQAFDEIADRATRDKRLASYRQRRDALVDTADNHRELARWCVKNRLSDEARVHWLQVLKFDRADVEATAALQAWQRKNAPAAREQAERVRLAAAQRLEALQKWRGKLVKLREAIEHGSAAERDRALEELRQLSDSRALEALAAVFGEPAAGDAGERRLLLLIETAGRMPQRGATELLLRAALGASSEKVMRAAADELKKRPLHHYVPQLLAAMPGVVNTEFAVNVLPDGSVVHEHRLEFRTTGGTLTMTYDSVVQPTEASIAPRVAAFGLNQELAKATQIEQAVAAEQKQTEKLRERISQVLKHSAGFSSVEDPRLWAQEYADHYGWTAPEQADITQYAWEHQVYYPIKPQPRSESRAAASSNGDANPATGASATPGPASGPIPLPVPQAGVTTPGGGWRMPFSGECFAAGTSVMTLGGLRPIETIEVGDRVLSQDVRTGELAFKTVEMRTLRRSKLVQLNVGGETLLATPGHPLWVVGQGWQVAKHLEPGARLHGLREPMVVDRGEDVGPREVYNLVVSDFGTFFVGKAGLLVHDDTQLNDTGEILPGLLSESETP